MSWFDGFHTQACHLHGEWGGSVEAETGCVPSAAMVAEQWLLVRFLPSTSGNSERMVSHTIPAYEPALCPRMKRESLPCILLISKIYWADFRGRHTPTSGCATNNLVKSRRPCMYPGHGGFLCAGIIGQKRNSFMARLMICACNWSALGIPKTRHQVCAPIGHGDVQQQVFCVASACNCASPCIPIVLFAKGWPIHMHFLFAS